MFNCKCCSKLVDEHKMVTCCICQNKFYHQCVDLSAAEVRTIKIKSNLKWSCSDCTDLGSNLNDLKSLIVSLKKEIEELKVKFTSKIVDNKSSFPSYPFEEVLHELSDRNARKSNIIIFGIPETPGNASREQSTTDNEAVLRTLRFLVPSTDINPISLFRLGKYDPSKPRPRPIKVKLPRDELVGTLLKNTKNLKTNKDFSNIVIASDRTPRQQEHYRSVRMELQQRLNNGETNLTIKYVKGIPSIVPLN